MTRALKPPSLLSCLWWLAVMNLLPRVIGLRRTFAAAKRLAGRAGHLDDPAVVEETARRVILMAAFYPRRALCLEQSLALVVLLRRRGVDAVLRLGAEPLPFSAHVWVEAAGRPVKELGAPRQHLALFPVEV